MLNIGYIIIQIYEIVNIPIIWYYMHNKYTKYLVLLSIDTHTNIWYYYSCQEDVASASNTLDHRIGGIRNEKHWNDANSI